MKINKLLFFFIALFSFAACTTEYVDYGVRPEIPISGDFKANLIDTGAKYVGDEFAFASTFSNLDVTSATDFKVNGVAIFDNTYTPTKEGEHTVLATLQIPGEAAKTATFKFNVLKKDGEPEEPEPTGNRIEYNGVNPLNTTYFILNGIEDEDGVTIPELTMPDGVTPALNWVMINFNGTNPNTATNIYMMDVLVPMNGNNIVFPFQTNQIAVQNVQVMVNGTATFTVANVTLNFAATGNTAPTQQAPGNANYTSVATGAQASQEAKLFWNGPFELGIQDLGAKPKSKSAFNNYKALNKLKTNKLRLTN